MKRTISILLGLALVLGFSLVATTPVAAGTTYYVDDSGSDSNGGTSWGNAWLTIQHAVDNVASGDTIMVGAGTYQESKGGWRDIEIFKSLSIIGAGSGSTVVELSGLQHGIEIRPDGTGALVMQGMTFTKRTANPKSADWAIIVAELGGTFNSLTFRDVEVAWGQARNLYLASATYHSVVLDDCNIHDAGTWGFSVRGTVDSLVVKDSHFDYSGWYDASHGIGFDIDMPISIASVNVTGGTFNYNKSKGINLVKTSNAVFTDITASNNGGAPGGGFGVSLWEWSGTSQDLAFDSPVLEDNATDGFLIGSEHGMTVSNVSIRCGTITGNGRAGLFVYRASGWGDGVIEDVAITRSHIAGNTQWGVAAIMAYENIDARNNWWGDDNGPSGAGPGTGDAVSNNVDFTPWVDNSVTTATATGSASFATSEGNVLGLTAVTPPGTPPVALPHGMFNFTICCLTGSTATLSITFPQPIPVGYKWWKYVGGSWYSLPIGSDDGDNFITVTLRDNVLPDDEDIVPGQITDQGGPGEPGAVGWDTYPISKVRVFLPWIALLVAIAAGASLMVLRRRRVQS
jgi:hypothetical protein